MTDGQKLLADYVTNGSEPAFRELVARHVDLVYSTAMRLVNGDAHRAQDVSQTVFADLAKLARTLPAEVMLGGWLHRHTCFVAVNLMRGERRRLARERQVAEMNEMEDHTAANLSQVAPILDEAINRLSAEDRAAILLRFFERRDLRSVGESLGLSENAAQKRVSRALEELRALLKNRGAAFSAAALGTALAAEAVTAAPAGLAVGISTMAVAGGGTASTILKFMTLSKLQAGIIGAVVIAGVATPLWLQQRAVSRLRADNANLSSQVTQMAALQAENERLSNAAAKAQVVQAPASGDVPAELRRLRSEATRLQNDSQELAKMKAGAGATNAKAAAGVDLNGFMAFAKEQARKDSSNSVATQVMRMNAKLNLSEEQQQAIREILMSNAVSRIERDMPFGVTEAERAKVQEQPADPTAEIKALLTAEQQAEYADFQQGEQHSSARDSANATVLKMKKDLGLTQAQQDQAFAILSDLAAQQPITVTATVNDSVDVSVNRATQQLERVSKALEGVLSPEQLELYRKTRAAEIQDNAESMKMMQQVFGQRSAGTKPAQ